MSDIILKSKSIFTSDSKNPFSGSIIIKNGLIRTIDTGKDHQTQPPGEQEVIDCGDRTILPGFCDSHIHGFLGSLQAASADLSLCRSETETAESAADFALKKRVPPDAKSEQAWVFGFGWNHYNWDKPLIPSRRSLDRYIADRPVCLFNEEMHSPEPDAGHLPGPQPAEL